MRLVFEEHKPFDIGEIYFFCLNGRSWNNVNHAETISAPASHFMDNQYSEILDNVASMSMIWKQRFKRYIGSYTNLAASIGCIFLIPE